MKNSRDACDGTSARPPTQMMAAADVVVVKLDDCLTPFAQTANCILLSALFFRAFGSPIRLIGRSGGIYTKARL